MIGRFFRTMFAVMVWSGCSIAVIDMRVTRDPDMSGHDIARTVIGAMIAGPLVVSMAASEYVLRHWRETPKQRRI